MDRGFLVPTPPELRKLGPPRPLGPNELDEHFIGSTLFFLFAFLPGLVSRSGHDRLEIFHAPPLSFSSFLSPPSTHDRNRVAAAAKTLSDHREADDLHRFRRQSTMMGRCLFPHSGEERAWTLVTLT
ncbi:hypothetical protein PDE_00123 [Penicillium oxalicum 114-2]|uniref:Uncharacterized protein n=1 Tax=Penicillium oxalicum (strain 114-2 / CGMCC 5302) TaxID=933388 RepID=S7Z942_PENO1|nr:hypothetical protein PDE_00123 [Penicillium oxalicum 114-2]